MAIFARTREREGAAQDIAALQQFIQARNALAGIRGLPAGQAGGLQGLQLPRAQSRAGIDLFSRFLLEQQGLAGRLAIAGAGQQPGFTLSPGQTRFGAGGQPIAQVPAAPPTPVSSSFQQIKDPATGQQINALVNPRTGNIIKKFGTIEEGLSAKDKTQIAVTQAREFRADPRIKNLGIVERSERGMAAALTQARKGGKANRIASDQALGVLFQKMLDPTSVVRESEFARTAQGASFINRITGSIKQLVTGGLGLEDEDRQALVDMAQKLLQEAKISANRAFDEFSIRADTIGLNKKIVFGGAKKFGIAEQSQLGQPITATNPQTGEKIQSSDGGQTWRPIQ